MMDKHTKSDPRRDIFQCTCSHEALAVESWHDEEWPEQSSVAITFYDVWSSTSIFGDIPWRLRLVWKLLKSGDATECGGCLYLEPDHALRLARSLARHAHLARHGTDGSPPGEPLTYKET
jgi:hypothetical protein